MEPDIDPPSLIEFLLVAYWNRAVAEIDWYDTCHPGSGQDSSRIRELEAKADRVQDCLDKRYPHRYMVSTYTDRSAQIVRRRPPTLVVRVVQVYPNVGWAANPTIFEEQ